MEDQPPSRVGWRRIARRDEPTRNAPDDWALVYDIVLGTVRPRASDLRARGASRPAANRARDEPRRMAGG